VSEGLAGRLSRAFSVVAEAFAGRLGFLERWLFISFVTALSSSLFIGIFYLALKIVVAVSAVIHGVSPEKLHYTTDYAILALTTRNYTAIAVTVLGFTALASLIVYRLAPEAEGGGTDAVVEAYHHRGGMIRPRVAIVKAVASALLLGGGGSGGPEGPAVQIGGASGSLVAKLLGLSVEERKIALIAGVAAALSFIFQSPVGAAIFAVEILYMYDIEATALVPSLMASVIAYSLSLHILGPGYKLPSIELPDLLTLYDFDAVASYILLGVFIAPFAYLYIYAMRTVKEASGRLVEKGVPIYAKPLVGAAAAMLLGLMLPQVLGIGEEYLAESLRRFQHLLPPPGLDTVSITLLLALAVAKIVATSLVVGSGGSGGLLAPGLYAGAMAGMAFGLLVSDYTDVGPALYAYLGMAALFGAASNIPLGMSFMVAEIGGSPALVVPALVASYTAHMLVRGVSIVESQLPHRVPPQVFTAETLLALLRERRVCVPVEEAASRTVVVARWDEPLSQVARRLLSARHRVAVVVDDEMRVLGVLDIAYAGIDLRYALRSSEPVSEMTLVTAPTVLKGSCMDRALEQMIIYGTDYVVVVDENRRFIGFVHVEDIVSLVSHMIVAETGAGRQRSRRGRGLGDSTLPHHSPSAPPEQP